MVKVMEMHFPTEKRKTFPWKQKPCLKTPRAPVGPERILGYFWLLQSLIQNNAKKSLIQNNANKPGFYVLIGPKTWFLYINWSENLVSMCWGFHVCGRRLIFFQVIISREKQILLQIL